MKNLLILLFFIILLSVMKAESKESRIPIVVIDSGVSHVQSRKPYMCENGVQSIVGDLGIDNHGHGTNIVSIISSKINKKYCIISIKVYTKSTANIQQYAQGLNRALKYNPYIINISMDGDEYDLQEETYIKRALMMGSKVVVAAGNNGINLDFKCKAYPSCLKKTIHSPYTKNMFVVSTTDVSNSNYGSIVTNRMSGKKMGIPVMSGTSQAAASLTSTMVQK